MLANDRWRVQSNHESGEGYADLMIEMPAEKTGCVIEVKYAENGAFAEACIEAMKQIDTKEYPRELQLDGIRTVYAYGIAFFRKKGLVKCKKIEI